MRAGKVVRFLQPSPKQIAGVQIAGVVLPIGRAVHERLELVVLDRRVEPLGPEMAGISQDHFSSLKQDGMIIGGIPGEARVRWKLLQRLTDRVQFRALRHAEARLACLQTSKERNEAGKEKDDTGHGAERERPLGNQSFPDKREDDEISPDDDLDIVPFPRRRLDQVAQQEDRDRRAYKWEDGRQFRIRCLGKFFPGVPDSYPNDHRRKNYNQVEPKFRVRLG